MSLWIHTTTTNSTKTQEWFWVSLLGYFPPGRVVDHLTRENHVGFDLWLKNQQRWQVCDISINPWKQKLKDVWSLLSLLLSFNVIYIYLKGRETETGREIFHLLVPSLNDLTTARAGPGQKPGAQYSSSMWVAEKSNDHQLQLKWHRSFASWQHKVEGAIVMKTSVWYKITLVFPSSAMPLIGGVWRGTHRNRWVLCKKETRLSSPLGGPL